MPPPRNVLIVDDHADIAEALKAAVEQEGYDVVVARTGVEALSVLPTVQPCIILLDLFMPDMDGYEFRQQQMSDAGIAHIPVVVISAAGLADEARAVKLGMRFFRKPVLEFDELVGVIREHCDANGGVPPSWDV